MKIDRPLAAATRTTRLKVTSPNSFKSSAISRQPPARTPDIETNEQDVCRLERSAYPQMHVKE